MQEKGTLSCDGCGEEFLIGHHFTSVDWWVAEKQVKWLATVEKIIKPIDPHEPEKAQIARALTNSIGRFASTTP